MVGLKGGEGNDERIAFTVVVVLWLDVMILEGFKNPNKSLILWYFGHVSLQSLFD